MSFPPPAPGTAGYAEAADQLAQQYESVSFTDVYSDFARFVPLDPSNVLDIGAGSGRDAAAMAAFGHRVVAVEPTAELRELAQQIHPHPSIEWIDDSLPGLPNVRARDRQFDLVLMTAVWMHLDEAERRQALPVVASLLAPGGRILLSLRHGPVPDGRRMFDVPAEELVNEAEPLGLSLLARKEREDMLGRDQVRWTLLALTKA